MVLKLVSIRTPLLTYNPARLTRNYDAFPPGSNRSWMMVESFDPHLSVLGKSAAAGLPPLEIDPSKGESCATLEKSTGDVVRNNLKKPTSVSSPSRSRNCHGDSPPSPYPIARDDLGGSGASIATFEFPAPVPNGDLYQSTMNRVS
jgi:hypothetical protein